MLYTLGMITPTTAVIILIIALIIFGPGKLPEIGKSLGRGIREFKEATSEPETKKLPEQRAHAEAPKSADSNSKSESQSESQSQ